MVLVRLELAEVAVDAAARGVEDEAGARQRMASTTWLVRSVPWSKSTEGSVIGLGDVGVRRQMDDGVVARIASVKEGRSATSPLDHG